MSHRTVPFKVNLNDRLVLQPAVPPSCVLRTLPNLTLTTPEPPGICGIATRAVGETAEGIGAPDATKPRLAGRGFGSGSCRSVPPY